MTLKVAQKAIESIHGMSGFVKWFNRDPARSNQHCLYCGRYVGAGSTVESDEEHLVGRNFVPRGSMDNAFNFSFRTCRPCNAEKARLEGHVSSVTLLPSPSVPVDEKARRAAERKAARDTHPETGKKMGEAIERQSVGFKFGPATLSFGMTGRSPAAKDFVPLLASFHIQALFSLITKARNDACGEIPILPLNQFHVFDSYPHTDWGNPQLVEITQRAAGWPCRFVTRSGDGHFLACLRRNEKHGWFWALEWNKSLRIIGGINLPEEPTPIFSNLPKLEWKPLPDGSGRFRIEQSTPDLGEILFPLNG